MLWHCFEQGGSRCAALRWYPASSTLPSRLACPLLQGAVLPPGFMVPPGITIHTQPGDFD